MLSGVIGIKVTDGEWQQFVAATKAIVPNVVASEEDSKLYAAIIFRKAFLDVINRWLEQGPYKVLGSKEIGWHVYFWQDEERDPRLMDTEDPDKPHKDPSNARRKARTLNRKWNLANWETDRMIERDGAIIL